MKKSAVELDPATVFGDLKWDSRLPARDLEMHAAWVFSRVQEEQPENLPGRPHPGFFMEECPGSGKSWNAFRKTVLPFWNIMAEQLASGHSWKRWLYAEIDIQTIHYCRSFMEMTDRETGTVTRMWNVI